MQLSIVTFKSLVHDRIQSDKTNLMYWKVLKVTLHETRWPSRVQHICQFVLSVHRESCQWQLGRRQWLPCTQRRWFDPTQSAAVPLSSRCFQHPATTAPYFTTCFHQQSTVHQPRHQQVEVEMYWIVIFSIQLNTNIWLFSVAEYEYK